jgi:hypothetical protein
MEPKGEQVEEEKADGRTDIRVLLRPARYPCDCGECRPDVVPVVVGVLPALEITYAEDSGRLDVVNIDSTGPSDLEELADWLGSMADSLRSGDVVPVEGFDGAGG